MGIFRVVLGCLVGVCVFLLLALVTPIAHYGVWSTGLLVALCLIFTEVWAYAPWFVRRG